jgi:diacylglycerol kinase (ATP)
VTDPGTKNRAIHRRARYSLRGLGEGWRRERSIRDCLIGCLVGIAALALASPAPIWWGLCLFAGAMSLALEYVNAALESLLDRLHPEMHPAIGAAKDMASSAALVLNIAAIGIVALALTQG